MKEALILAGGKGTRLRSVTNGGQKVAVRVGNQTFIELLLKQLEAEGFSQVYLALGYRADDVKKIVSQLSLNLEIHFILERTPLGTGGAVKNAMKFTSSNNILVLNGDTYNEFDYSSIIDTHEKTGAHVTVLVKSVDNISRYGEVKIGAHQTIIKFTEKTGLKKPGVINSGVYVFKKNLLKDVPQEAFSLEEFLTNHVNTLLMKAVYSDGRFFDIGTPKDYHQFIALLKY